MATFHQIKNNAVGTVQNNPLSSGGTNLVTDSTLGTLLASLTFPYYLTIWGANLNPNTDASMEIVEVTANPSSNNFTIVRARQGTTGVSHAQGSIVGLLWTKGNSDEAVPLGTVAQGAVYFIDSAGLPHLLAPGTSGNFLKTQGAGADPVWASVAVGAFGDGSDGNVTISSPTVLARDMYYNNLTVNSTLDCAQYRIFVNGTLSGNGTIFVGPGGNGGNGVDGGANSGGQGGTAGAAIAAGYFPASAAGQTGGAGTNGASAGANGTAGPSVTSGIGSNGVSGGNGGSGSNAGGGTGGAAGSASIFVKFGVISFSTITGLDINASGATVKVVASAGSGSGAGGGGQTSPLNKGGGGGGSGAAGGIIFIMANIWAGTFTIQAIGGNGGNGGIGLVGAGGGGGGGGGNGGTTIVIYGTKTWTGSYVLTGGTKGTGGVGAQTNGSDGTNGTTGTSYELAVTTLTR